MWHNLGGFFLLLIWHTLCLSPTLAQQARQLSQTIKRLQAAGRFEDALYLLAQDSARTPHQQLFAAPDRNRLIAEIQRQYAQTPFQPDLLKTLQKPVVRDPVSLEPLAYEHWWSQIVTAAKISAPDGLQALTNFFTQLKTILESVTGQPITNQTNLQQKTGKILTEPIATNESLKKELNRAKGQVERSQMAYSRALIGDIVFYIIEHHDNASNILRALNIDIKKLKHLNDIRPKIQSLANSIPAIDQKVLFLEKLRDQLKEIGAI